MDRASSSSSTASGQSTLRRAVGGKTPCQPAPASAINADGAVPGILTPLFSGYWWGIRRILEDAGFTETEATWREGPFLDPHADAAQWLGELLDALAEMPLILMLPPHFDASPFKILFSRVPYYIGSPQRDAYFRELPIRGSRRPL